MKPLSVYAVGTEVVVGSDITAIVTAVSIRSSVQYECSWWDGRTHHSKWLEECEVFTGKGTRMRIGFANGDADAAR